MKNTVLIELKDENAINLLYDLEKMNILQIIKEVKTTIKTDIASRFAGVLSKKEGESLEQHIKLAREEWDKRT